MKKLLLTDENFSFVFMWRQVLHIQIGAAHRAMCGTTIPRRAERHPSRVKAQEQVCQRCSTSALHRHVARLEESEAQV